MKSTHNTRTLMSALDPKELHRIRCTHSIPTVRNIIPSAVSSDPSNETVLIEFRALPHIEFLIRNVLIKLPHWKHTVVCGNKNVQFIKTICKDLSINIIHLNIDNLTACEYSKLLMTKTFWEQFSSEKLLIYQEDSYLFHSDIEPFLEYDYIGAAWPAHQDDNAHGVGNGGFSLRSREKMIACIENPKKDSLVIGDSTRNYMRSTRSDVCPEDVFFSKSLIDFNLGKVATREVANLFSQETQQCGRTLGGHNFFWAKNNKTFYTTLKLDNDYYTKVLHRGGWKHVIKNMIEKNLAVTSPQMNTITFVDCIESRFDKWGSAPRPLLEPWVGIFHYSVDLPPYAATLKYISRNENVVKSLPYCRGLMVLSKKNYQYIKSDPLYKNIPLIALKHPIEIIPQKFSVESFLKQPMYGIVQLGLQDRKTTTIYKLNTKLQKYWLPGRSAWNHYLDIECKHFGITVNKHDVKVLHIPTHSGFDEMLRSNIVIIPLFDAAANNSVLEIIEMNIPAFVTRLQATEEYLGTDYPLLYESEEEVEAILNDQQRLVQKLKEGTVYLEQMDKSDLRYEHFNREIYKFISS
jgi:hypothetical protein